MDTTGFDDAFGAYNGPQVIYDMSAKAYHSDADGPRLSQSLATMCVNQSPLHAWQKHPLLGNVGFSYEGNTSDGTLIHSLVLEPDSEDVVELDFENFRTKAAQEARDATIASGKIPMLAEKLGAYRYKAKAIRSRLYERGIAFDGKSEVTIYWQEETPSGVVRCRARLDHLEITPDAIRVVDLKSTESANPRDLKSSCWRYAYDIQEAAYVRAVTAAFPDYAGRVSMLFAFAELEKPYAVSPITLNGEFRTLGEARWVRGRDLWAKCLNADDWTGYAGGDLAPPAWAMTEEMGE
jgi:hypothetical protein